MEFGSIVPPPLSVPTIDIQGLLGCDIGQRQDARYRSDRQSGKKTRRNSQHLETRLSQAHRFGELGDIAACVLDADDVRMARGTRDGSALMFTLVNLGTL